MYVCMYVCGKWLLERLMTPSPKSQVMFASAFSWIGDFLVFLPFIPFTQRPLFTRRVHMHLTPAVVASGACGALRLVGGHHNNVRGVTAGKVGHNSSTIQYKYKCLFQLSHNSFVAIERTCFLCRDFFGAWSGEEMNVMYINIMHVRQYSGRDATLGSSQLKARVSFFLFVMCVWRKGSNACLARLW